MSVGVGTGAEERRTIAVVVIGGQLLSLVLTLLVTPVAHPVLNRAFGRGRSAVELSSLVGQGAPES